MHDLVGVGRDRPGAGALTVGYAVNRQVGLKRVAVVVHGRDDAVVIGRDLLAGSVDHAREGYRVGDGIRQLDVSQRVGRVLNGGRDAVAALAADAIAGLVNRPLHGVRVAGAADRGHPIRTHVREILGEV